MQRAGGGTGFVLEGAEKIHSASGVQQSQQGGGDRAQGVNLDRRAWAEVEHRQGCLREPSWVGVQGLRSGMGAACPWPWTAAG